MAIPIKKLLSVTDNRYEFTVAAMQIVDKTNGTIVKGEEYETWKIVPKVLENLLNGNFKYSAEETDASRSKKDFIDSSQESSIDSSIDSSIEQIEEQTEDEPAEK